MNGSFPRVLPGPEVGVEEVDADGFGLDHHLAGAGGGLLFVDVGQDFGSAGLGDFNGVHADYPAKV